MPSIPSLPEKVPDDENRIVIRRRLCGGVKAISGNSVNSDRVYRVLSEEVGWSKKNIARVVVTFAGFAVSYVIVAFVGYLFYSWILLEVLRRQGSPLAFGIFLLVFSAAVFLVGKHLGQRRLEWEENYSDLSLPYGADSSLSGGCLTSIIQFFVDSFYKTFMFFLSKNYLGKEDLAIATAIMTLAMREPDILAREMEKKVLESNRCCTRMHFREIFRYLRLKKLLTGREKVTVPQEVVFRFKPEV